MSKNTKNYKLYTFTNDSDVADLKLLEPTFDTIDKGLVLDVGESTGSGNNYILNLGSITLTSANKGISFKFWADKNASGAVKINGTYKLIKAGGSSVTNLKKGAPYTITYDGGTNFFLASGGGADTVNFTSDKLLTGYSANDSNGEKVNGTMPNKGTSTNTLGLNGSLTLPSGYYDSIKVTQSITTRGSTTDAKSQGVNGDYIYTRIPQGAYFTNASTGYPEIKSKFSDIAKAIGLTADKLVGTVGGITGTGKVFYNKTIDVTIPANATTFNVNIGFKPTTVILRILTPSGVQADNWIHARSTDITWFTHAWIEEKTSSSSSYTPTTQIDSLTNTGFVYRVQQSGGSYSTDKSYKFQIFAIG